MGSELAIMDNFDLAIVAADSTPVELVETLQETLGGRLRPYDLQRIVWPSGKATSWEIPTVGGDTTPAKEIVAVPILTTVSRQFWERKSVGPDTTPPVCKSDDGERGEPTERGRELGATGDCRSCPLAQWGRNNTPPACKERRELFLLMEGQYFPMVLSVPPSSVKVWKDFVKPLSLQGIAPWGTVVRLRLTTAANPNGDPYALLKLELVGKLPAEHRERLRQYREALTATFRAGLEATRLERNNPALVASTRPSTAAPVATAEPKRPEFNELGEEMPLEE
jgi:hypothetical protein